MKRVTLISDLISRGDPTNSSDPIDHRVERGVQQEIKKRYFEATVKNEDAGGSGDSDCQRFRRSSSSLHLSRQKVLLIRHVSLVSRLLACCTTGAHFSHYVGIVRFVLYALQAAFCRHLILIQGSLGEYCANTVGFHQVVNRRKNI